MSEHEPIRPQPPLSSDISRGRTRRELLSSGGLLAAAGLVSFGGSALQAQTGGVKRFQADVLPRYFPRDDFAPDLYLAGKVAVITGASRGIGLATGLALQDQGVTVIGTSRSPGQYGGHPFPLLTLDITDQGSVDAFVGSLVTTLNGQSIDILINNAGRFVVGTPTPSAPALVGAFETSAQLAMETLHLGHVRVTNRLLPLMTSAGYARVLFTVSVAAYAVGGTDLGESIGASFFHVYQSGKRALLAYANGLRGFLRVSGSPIRISTVNPMFTNTPLADGLHPIFLEPVDGSGNSANPYLQAVLQGTRNALANAQPASLVGETYRQLLSMANPPPNVVAGSSVEPYASQGLSGLVEQGLLDENAESAMPLGATRPGQ